MKNNAIQRRKGIKLDFVPAYFKDEFTKDCIDFAINEKLGFWSAGIPSLEGSVLDQLSKKYLMAVLLGIARNDKTAFQKEVLNHEWNEDFFEYWVQANIFKIGEANPELLQLSMAGLYEDARKVLLHHHILFASRLDDGSYPGTGLQGFSNIPIMKIW